MKYNDLPIMPREELTKKLLTVGESVKIWVQDNHDVYKVHIDAIIQYPNTDDDLNKVIVYRFYGKHKQYWHYKTRMLWEILFHNGYAEVTKEL